MSWLSTKILKPLCLIVVLFLTVLFESAALAQTVDVRVDGDNGLAVPNPPNPGDTWTNAFRYLPDALAEAKNLLDLGEATTVRLWVAATDPSNTYRPNRDAANPFGICVQSTFLLNFNNVRMLGGFPPGGGDLADRDPAVNITVLSGKISCFQGGGPAKAYHVVTVDGVDESVRINGFTITDGLANGGGDNGVGAGMLILNASPAVVRVTFTENSAPGHGGGAMHIEGTSNPLVVNCEFIANSGNEAGALHTETGMAGGTFINCLFSGNSSIVEGGAINPGANGDVNFINCTFADNTVNDPDGGGAIFTELPGSGLVNLTNCILWGNRADGNPNQINDSQDEVTVSYSDVEGTIDPDWDGGNNINDDPLFVDPDGPDNDPDTFDDNDYRLLIGSPCFDVGNNAVVPCDQFDVNDDGITCDENDPELDQPTPDLDLGNRIVSLIVDMGAYEVACPWDLDGSCDVGVSDFLDLLGAWGPCPPTGGCPADFDNSGDVGVSDFLELLANWGSCPCDTGPGPLSLEEELADACLTMDDWDNFVDVMTDPESSQEDKDRYDCWMRHYLFDCNNCICTHFARCPAPDPFN